MHLTLCRGGYGWLGAVHTRMAQCIVFVNASTLVAGRHKTGHRKAQTRKRDPKKALICQAWGAKDKIVALGNQLFA